MTPGSTMSEESVTDEVRKRREGSVDKRAFRRIETPADIVGTALFLGELRQRFCHRTIVRRRRRRHHALIWMDFRLDQCFRHDYFSELFDIVYLFSCHHSIIPLLQSLLQQPARTNGR